MEQVTAHKTRLDKGNAYWMAFFAKSVYEEQDLEQSLKAADPEVVRVATFDNRSSQAALIEHENYYCMAFRGTDEIADWKDNVKFRKADGPLGEFHRGFLGAVNDVWGDIHGEYSSWKSSKAKPLFITGHSLGGAMATVAAARLVEMDAPFTSVYTFGQPRVMDRDAARVFNSECKERFFRFHNKRDVVTRVPFRVLGYSHVGSYLYISDDIEIHPEPGFWFRFVDFVTDVVEEFGNFDLEAVEDHKMKYYISAIKRWKLAD